MQQLQKFVDWQANKILDPNTHNLMLIGQAKWDYSVGLNGAIRLTTKGIKGSGEISFDCGQYLTYMKYRIVFSYAETGLVGGDNWGIQTLTNEFYTDDTVFCSSEEWPAFRPYTDVGSSVMFNEVRHPIGIDGHKPFEPQQLVIFSPNGIGRRFKTIEPYPELDFTDKDEVFVIEGETTRGYNYVQLSSNKITYPKVAYAYPQGGTFKFNQRGSDGQGGAGRWFNVIGSNLNTTIDRNITSIEFWGQ